jgi:hypothetical protein
MRPVTFWTAFLAGLLAFGLYFLAHDVQRLQRQGAEVRRQIAQEVQALQTLKAEWAYLNRPDRLQTLVAVNQAALGLVAASPQQTASFAALWQRPEILARAVDGQLATPPRGKPSLIQVANARRVQ